MKTLYLVRHAKAGWHDPAMADFDRRLTKRGHKQADEMSHRLHKQKIMPELLISSPASRAIETAEIFADTLGIERELIMQKIEIYEGQAEALAAIVQALPDEYGTAMLFGHNPVISAFADWLTGKSIGNMHTCGIVKIELDIPRWKEAVAGSGTLDWYEFPEKG
ncbi:MAG TPA: histidine phosphatase family protein [Chlorobaculum parvum]|uniref:Histidine phosphatase family protein n=1 Tax=Chlorobaculum parvum TaxID=274539 RepID=A0A7C5HK38_9CHLB|nr:histidine phosphatase family protein [Chlorobaculum parvum]